MTREEQIMVWARKAGFSEYELEDYTPSGFDIRYERFAALVAAAEREAIIKATIDQGFVGQAYADDFATTIRNRGKE